MSDTPRTDDHSFPLSHVGGSDEVVSADFSRTLERELATVTKELNQLREDKARLDWLTDYISQNGGNGIAEIPWTQTDPDEIMEDRIEIVFDRAAIDNAMKVQAAD